MAGNAATAGITVTSRVLAILGSFDEDHRELTLSDLAQRAGLSLPTTHRLVGELADWGALRRRSTGAYVIGRRLWDVGLLAPVQTGLRQVASPFLNDVYATTLSTVHLAVRDDNSVLYLDRLAGTSSFPVVSQVGSRLPLHCTGVGKVLLAHASEEVVATAMTSLTRMTRYTLTQPRLLAAQLERVRREGYAQTNEEMTIGACSVAVPVRHRDGAVIAGLGVVVPSLRRDKTRLVAVLQVAAAGISRSLPP